SALFGAATGAATGVGLSKFIDLDAADYFETAYGSTLGAMAGLGVPLLLRSEAGRHDRLGLLGGSVLGLAAGATAATLTDLRGPDAFAATAGLGYGALLGTLAPTLGADRWDGERKAAGGALVGASVLSAGAAAATHLTGASSAEVAVPFIGGLLGLSAGTGAGLMVDADGLRGARIGAVAGTSVALAGAIAGDRLLHFSSQPGPSTGLLLTSGAGAGTLYGLLLANALRQDDEALRLFDQRGRGGALLGTSAGAATGLVLSQLIAPDVSDVAVAGTASVLGGMIGLGVPMMTQPETGRPDRVGLLTGSLLGLGGGAAVARYVELTGVDVAAATLGGGYGGLVGLLAPTLHLQAWDGSRRTTGATLTGASEGV
ncbi:MAG: hypothetical protein ACK4N5_25745, partial [Myxococcales bacterium]